MIPSTQLPGNTDRVCGSTFAPIDGSATPGTVIGDAASPFVVQTFSLATIGNAALTSVDGYSLDFTQVPCTN